MVAPFLCSCLGFLSPLILRIHRSPSRSLSCSPAFILFFLHHHYRIQVPVISLVLSTPPTYLGLSTGCRLGPVLLSFHHCACARQSSDPICEYPSASSLKSAFPSATLIFTTPAKQPALSRSCFFSLLISDRRPPSLARPKSIYPLISRRVAPCVALILPFPLVRQPSSLKAHFSTLNTEAALLLRRL